MDNQDVLQLSKDFASLGAALHGGQDNATAMERLVALAVVHIPGCSWASITVLRGKVFRSLAVSGEVARTADHLQYTTGEGPCLSAAEDDATYRLFDVSTETRWPAFCAALAEQTPVHSVLSFQLASKKTAALNLFADASAGWDDDSVLAGAVFAAHASSAVALYEAEDRAVQLRVALETSRDIGAAVGVLMSHHKITREAAFAMLSAASQQLNRKLRDVADQVVETGVLPTPDPPARPPVVQTGHPRLDATTKVRAEPQAVATGRCAPLRSF